MWGRTLRSKLDLLRPDVDQKAQQATDHQKSSHDVHSSQRQFAVNETVYARNYGSGPQWLPVRIVSLQGNAMYCVRLLDNREIVRHVDQLRPLLTTGEQETPIESGVEDTGSTGGAPNTQTEEPEPAEADLTDPEASDTLPDPPTEACSGRNTESTPPPLPGTQNDSDQPPVMTTVRRSTRVIQPPDRYNGHYP